MINIVLETAEAEVLQQAVEQHLDLCYLAIECEYNDMTEEELILMDDFKPFDVFCGCPTCVAREIIMKTFEYLNYIGKVNITLKEEKNEI